MKHEVLYAELLSTGRVIVARDMWAELSSFILFCKERGTFLRGGFATPQGIEFYLR